MISWQRNDHAIGQQLGGAMTKNQTLITAAGGNGTAIEILDQALTRQEYESRGKAREWLCCWWCWAGWVFLVLGDRHFEMAGGEFCGNATRSAADCTVRKVRKATCLSLSLGLPERWALQSSLWLRKDSSLKLPSQGMVVKTKPAKLRDGTPVSIVDLGGIVHIVIEGEFPKKTKKMYTTAHRRIVDQFGWVSVTLSVSCGSRESLTKQSSFIL